MPIQLSERQGSAAMRVTYHWTEADWNEAVALATVEPRRRGSVPGMVYALVGIPLVGAIMDGARSVRSTGKLTGVGMTVPMLLIMLAATLGAGLLFAQLQRRRRVRSKASMPVGRWEVVVQEAGWSFHPKLDDVAESSALVNEAEGVAQRPIESASKMALANEAIVPTSVSPVLAELGSVGVAQTVAVTAAPISHSIQAAEPKTVQPRAQPIPGTAEAQELLTTPFGNEHVAHPPTLVAESAAEEISSIVAAPVAGHRSLSKKEIVLHPWNDLTGSRTGERAVVFLYQDGFLALPIRCMTPDQAGHLHRMVIRKLRPAPVAAVTRL